MNLSKVERFSKPLLRVGLSLVFLWFGFQQIRSPSSWTDFVPNFIQGIVGNFGISVNNLVMMNGIMELTLGIFLLIGLYTRFSSLILALHLFFITSSIGVNPVGVRDFGLAIATLVVFLNGKDDFCIDNKFGKKVEKEKVGEEKHHEEESDDD